jgi:hypothetical protein
MAGRGGAELRIAILSRAPATVPSLVELSGQQLLRPVVTAQASAGRMPGARHGSEEPDWQSSLLAGLDRVPR